MAYPPQEKLLAKDSIKRLFIKDYNWLYAVLGGLMKTKTKREIIRQIPFSTASAILDTFI
jgi:hypothetical protein